MPTLINYCNGKYTFEEYLNIEEKRKNFTFTNQLPNIREQARDYINVLIILEPQNPISAYQKILDLPISIYTILYKRYLSMIKK